MSKKCSHALILPTALRHHWIHHKNCEKELLTFEDSIREAYCSICIEITTIVDIICFHFNIGGSWKHLHHLLWVPEFQDNQTILTSMPPRVDLGILMIWRKNKEYVVPNGRFPLQQIGSQRQWLSDKHISSRQRLIGKIFLSFRSETRNNRVDITLK